MKIINGLLEGENEAKERERKSMARETSPLFSSFPQKERREVERKRELELLYDLM